MRLSWNEIRARATAVAEKLAVLDTVSFFAASRREADFEGFERIMQRHGGEPPVPEDAL